MKSVLCYQLDLSGGLAPKFALHRIAIASIVLALSASAQTTLLLKDDFNPANGTSLPDPATRATGALAATVKYGWLSSNTTDVIVDGTLNWDSNNNRNGEHQQPADTR